MTGINPPVNGIANLGLTNAVLRIINPNFQGYLNLSTNAYAANLSAGSVIVTVTRTVGSKGTPDRAVRHHQWHGGQRHGLYRLHQHPHLEQW